MGKYVRQDFAQWDVIYFRKLNNNNINTFISDMFDE